MSQLLPSGRLGPYEILAKIGEGGMGEVYRARDTKLNRDVALKILAESIATQPDAQPRFEREARSLAALNHPGIVTIYAVEEIDGKQVIAMEYLDGRQLSEHIPKTGLPLARFLAIAVQIADAVAAAHKHGIVHRDLKPANVMVGSGDRVKVLDFGLAKLREHVGGAAETVLPEREITGQGRIVGTVAYMSPEQAEGRPVDARSDVFSLGVLLYEMASGERPFKGDTSLSVLSAILKDAPRALGDVNPALPRELARFVRRCLSKNPDERYQSAFDLRSDLEDLRQSMLSGELSAPRSAAMSPKWPRLWLWLGAAALAIIAVAGTAWTRRSTIAAPAVPDLHFGRLTMVEGTASDPNISPDGQWAVYVSAISGNNDIYLQSTTGQTSINLTRDSAANEVAPAFSPDGGSIAFRSDRDGGGLFVMGRLGESVRRLTRTGHLPAWFPDGKRLVFTSVPAQPPESRAPGVSELWVVDAAGGEPRRLFAGDALNPRVSPNGLRIAYWGLTTNSERTTFTGLNRDVWTIAADGSNPVRVTTDEAVDWNPVWAPDGKWLYYLSNRRGSMNLWRIAIDESTGVPRGEPQALTAPSTYIRNFSLSADGQTGAFATVNQTGNLAAVPFDRRTASTSGEVRPLTTGSRDFANVEISPSGREVALMTAFRSQEDLFVLPVDGGSLRNLTNDVAFERRPRWMPDGRRLLFYSDRSGSNEIWSIDRDGGRLRQLTQTSGLRAMPVPTGDGFRIAAADLRTWTLYVYDARDLSKPLQELPRFPDEWRGGAFGPTDWTSDAKWLVGNSGGRPWLYSFESGAFRRLDTSGQDPRLLDDRRLLLTQQGRIVVVDIASGKVQPVLSIAGEVLASPRVSPDGTTLYFIRTTSSGDIWTVRFTDAER